MFQLHMKTQPKSLLVVTNLDNEALKSEKTLCNEKKPTERNILWMKNHLI